MVELLAESGTRGIANLIPFGLLGRVRAMERRDHAILVETQARAAALDRLATDRDKQVFDRGPCDGSRHGVVKIALSVRICLLFMRSYSAIMTNAASKK